jgi:hypothetical protein
MDALRIKGTQKEILQAWYTLYQTNIQGVDPSDIWNMDETGLSLGTVSNGLVLGSSSTRRTYKKTPGSSREWVSAIEAISAAGASLPPLIIFKG